MLVDNNFKANPSAFYMELGGLEWLRWPKVDGKRVRSLPVGGTQEEQRHWQLVARVVELVRSLTQCLLAKLANLI